MTAEQSSRRQRRWFYRGCALTVSSSLGLCAFPLLLGALPRHDLLVFSLACVLVVLMGLGAVVAIFNLRHS